MRFRYIQLSDIPDVARLYHEMHEERQPEELDYPKHTDKTVEEFTISLARQILGNPNWVGIVGVVGSRLEEDAQGVKHVVGGKAKGLITASLSERTVGSPRNIAFYELMVVDKNFRQRDVGRKLTHLMSIDCAQRGAQVLECAWNPGSLGEKLWTAAGILPYRVLGAWVDAEGNPRTDLPLTKVKPPDTSAEAPKRRGRPRKQQPAEG